MARRGDLRWEKITAFLVFAIAVFLAGVPASATPTFEVGEESLVGSVIITPLRAEDWQPVLTFPEGLSATEATFTCPGGYRCIYSSLGWAVLVERSITIAPGTGSLAFNLETVPTAVPEAGTFPLVAAALVVVWLAAFSGVLLPARRT
jgi:hypothetical protein